MPVIKTKDIEAKVRLDVLLAQELNISRAAAKWLCEQHQVKVEGRVAKPAEFISRESKVAANLGKLKPTQADYIKPKVIYEDHDLIVIDKPTGLLTHSKGGFNPEPTVATWLAQHLKKANNTTKPSFAGIIPVNGREGIVHRLDRGTSGVIVCAKNEQTQKWLQKQFSTRKVEKTYLAVVSGVPKNREALIDIPIGRNPLQPQTFKATNSGKTAQTHYKIINSLQITGKKYSLLEL